MKVSVNWLKEYADIDLSIDELVKKIGAQLGAVEEVVDLGKKYQGIVVAKVISCQKHPNADKLKVCKINTGQEEVQVVCGAPNVREGLLVAWLPPGSTVPATFDKDPLVLEAREIRGQMSNGMLASASELAISDDHDGILELNKGKPGDDFAKTFGLDDYIIDIENKMFTHRPDLFGMLGIAREVAGIQQQPFKSPEWYIPVPKLTATMDFVEEQSSALTIKNELPELVPRFTAVTMRNVQIGPSPLWLQIELTKIGIKSINNIVDYSNYFMLLTAQPIHIYDYDKVKTLGGTDQVVLVVRHPKSGEKLKLLNGKTIKPRSEAMMVATDKQLICLGGAMGGAETEVDDSTKNIIIEAATWDMFNMRRTAMEHGVFTDAVTRFTKGQSPLQNSAVVYRIMDEICQHAGGQIDGGAMVNMSGLDSGVLERQSLHAPINLSANFINDRLGLSLAANEMKTLLHNVEFRVEVQGDELILIAPFWRTDIEIPEDIVEEVGRLYGYDHLPLDLPKRSLVPVGPDKLLMLKKQLRRQMAKLGANEVLTYSFVHGGLLDKVGQDKSQAFKLANALSPDLQYYRLSLTPSLLDKVHMNVKAGYDQFAVFEIGKSHLKAEPDPWEPGVPKEVNSLSLVLTSDTKTVTESPGAAYYRARSYLDELLENFGAQNLVVYEPLHKADLYKNPWLEQMTAPYDPQRSAILRDSKSLIWGVVGEFKSSIKKTLKLPGYTAGFELDPLLFLQSVYTSTYRPMSKFPRISQDICLQVSERLPYADLAKVLDEALHKNIGEPETVEWQPIDIYNSVELKDQKRVTFRVTLTSSQQTLTSAALSHVLNSVCSAMAKSLKLTRI